MKISGGSTSYVMVSMATRMHDMLLLRPPTKEFLGREPPGHIVRALAKFETKRLNTDREAIGLTVQLGFELPA